MTWLRPGVVVGDRYEVEDLLGEGGMGVVMRARHRFTGERVALKMLHTHLALRRDLAARFLAEARAPAAIGHPGIVRVLDAGTAQNGEPYFAMELLEGEPLAAAMRRGPMPFEHIRRICLEILGALGAAHAAGFIHRDLKPENVFLTAPYGQVKLLDFGIAKSLGELESQSQTATGTSMGTLHYMSPEQLRNAKRVDHRTDLWAVGVIFYQMVTGQLPYFAESPGDMLLLTLSSPPRPLEERLAEVPPALAACLACALAADPNARFTSAGEMAAAIASIPPLVLRYHTGVVSQDSAPYHPVPPTMTAGPAVTATATPTATATGSPAPPGAGKAALLAAGGLALLVVVPIAAGLAFWLSRALQRDTSGTAAELDACAAACKRINACGAVYDVDKCTAWCEASPPTRECVKGADCTAIGACFIQGYCGKKPAGSRSCRDVAELQSKCQVNDRECVCSESHEVSPAEAGKLVVHNSCSFTRCESDCVGPFARNESCKTCYIRECGPQIDACR